MGLFNEKIEVENLVKLPLFNISMKSAVMCNNFYSVHCNKEKIMLKNISQSGSKVNLHTLNLNLECVCCAGMKK